MLYHSEGTQTILLNVQAAVCHWLLFSLSASCLIRTKTRSFTASRISRTVSSGLPLGFSTGQSSVRRPGMLELDSPADVKHM